MTFAISSSLPYRDYLKAQAVSDAIITEQRRGSDRIAVKVQSSTREILASAETLRDQNLQLEQAVTDGFDRISWDIQQSVESLEDATNRGFNSLLCHTGRMADTLESLLESFQNTNKTRSYEYFDDARGAFAHGHAEEALESVEKAIFGDHTTGGYKLEWRFHFLKGSILLGSTGNPDLVNLKEAEQCFRAAAKYAATDDNGDTVLALLGASWACYCQGKLDEALSLSEKALQLDPGSGQVLFQAAKINMADGQPDDALPRLATAMELDPRYLLKALGDNDFTSHSERLKAWIRDQAHSKKKDLESKYEAKSQFVDFWIQYKERNLKSTILVSNLTKSLPGLLDLLYALRTLRTFTFIRRDSTLNVDVAMNIVRAIPAQLNTPSKLLDTLAEKSRSWPLNAKFFQLARELISHGRIDGFRKLLLEHPDLKFVPLEHSAIRFEALTADPRVRRGLADALQKEDPSRREQLIMEFIELAGSGNYSESTTEAIREVLARQYEEWFPSFQFVPLKNSAALFEAFGVDQARRRGLADALQKEDPDRRALLIGEFEVLGGSGGFFSRPTIEAIHEALLSQYNKWLPVIEEKNKKTAYSSAAEGHPVPGMLKSLLFAFGWSLIPVLILMDTFGIFALVACAGLLAMYFRELMSERSKARRDHLRERREEEASLRKRINKSHQPRGRTRFIGRMRNRSQFSSQ